MSCGSSIVITHGSVPLRIAYTDSGKGPVLVFLHGWNHSGSVWGPVIGMVGENYRSITFDLPGFGFSDPLPRRDISIEAYATICARALRELTGPVAPLAIVGDSFGALVTMRMLNRNLVTGCGLLLSGCPADGLGPMLKLLAPTRLAMAGLSILKSLKPQHARKILRYLTLATVRKKQHISEVLLSSVLQAHPESSQGVLEAMLVVPAQNTAVSHSMRSVRVVRGQYDRIVSRNTAERLAHKLNGVFDEIPGVGHTPMLEDPERYALCIRNLLVQ